MTPDDDDTDTPNRRLLMLGVFGLAVSTLLGLLAPHEGSVWRLPQVLEQRAQTALLVSDLAGIEVVADGQRLIANGVVEDERRIGEVRRVLLTSSGAGGAWAGGVTSVSVAGVNVGAIERPYSWSARREADRLTLSGTMPSEAARARLLAQAQRSFSATDIVDDLHVAGGAPSPAFSTLTVDAVRLLAGLTSGEARVVDQQVVFIGDGSQAGVDALRAAFAEPPAPFRVRVDLTVDGLDVENPELQGLNLTNADAETCERAFERLMEGNVINFETGSAVIAPSSRGVLDRLASVALRCDRFSIEVAGFTDNQGGRAANMDLSHRRADAVAEYLVGQGVGPSRLIAQGYGPDRPRASNATPAGQAANRRIEFYVSSRAPP